LAYANVSTDYSHLRIRVQTLVLAHIRRRGTNNRRKKRASTSRLFVAEKLTTTRARGGASSSSSPVRQERKENSCFKKILIDGMAVASLYLVWRGTVIYDILYQMKTATSKSSKRRLTGLADIENRVDYHQPYPIPFQSTGPL
ncbi:hypothetical protein KCU87_g392, partial [Aureobasidium melanogenum]